MYRIETNELCLDMEKFTHLLDLSEYPKNQNLYGPTKTNFFCFLAMEDELIGLNLEKRKKLLAEDHFSSKHSADMKKSANFFSFLWKSSWIIVCSRCFVSGASIHRKPHQMRSMNPQLIVT